MEGANVTRKVKHDIRGASVVHVYCEEFENELSSQAIL